MLPRGPKCGSRGFLLPMKRKSVAVMTALNSKAEAVKLARLIVERRLAACVQISSAVVSIYRWRNKIVTDREWVLLVKTAERRYRALEKTIREHHPYELPEIIAIPIIRGEKKYLQWLDRTVQQTEE